MKIKTVAPRPMRGGGPVQAHRAEEYTMTKGTATTGTAAYWAGRAEEAGHAATWMTRALAWDLAQEAVMEASRAAAQASAAARICWLARAVRPAVWRRARS